MRLRLRGPPYGLSPPFSIKATRESVPQYSDGAGSDAVSKRCARSSTSATISRDAGQKPARSSVALAGRMTPRRRDSE